MLPEILFCQKGKYLSAGGMNKSDAVEYLSTKHGLSVTSRTSRAQLRQLVKQCIDGLQWADEVRAWMSAPDKQHHAVQIDSCHVTLQWSTVPRSFDEYGPRSKSLQSDILVTPLRYNVPSPPAGHCLQFVTKLLQMANEHGRGIQLYRWIDPDSRAVASKLEDTYQFFQQGTDTSSWFSPTLQPHARLFVMLGRETCYFSKRAQNLLQAQGHEYKFATHLPHDIPAYHTTVPAIFHGDVFVGGFTDLQTYMHQLRSQS